MQITINMAAEAATSQDLKDALRSFKDRMKDIRAWIKKLSRTPGDKHLKSGLKASIRQAKADAKVVADLGGTLPKAYEDLYVEYGISSVKSSAVPGKKRRSTSTRKEIVETPLDDILSPSEIKLLGKWCIDGTQSKGGTLAVFTSIRKKLEKAGEYAVGIKPTLYRGVNLSATQFEKFVTHGELPSSTDVTSWTSELDTASLYAVGSMSNKKQPFGVILKKKKGSYDNLLILQLRKLASRVGRHLKESAPFNRESLLKAEPISIKDATYVFSTEGYAEKRKGSKFAATIKKLADKGYVSAKVPQGTTFFSVTSTGNLVAGKPHPRLRYIAR